ncbi:uncharacterized protein IWZ02DRAFT_316909 [Phyllosticta citriasiana]|uniref:uncharacterized protein n=1 Tax=Phyllosticta citriasiana TaxID=595635 RepID=UPI0030FDDCFD
MDRFGPHPLLQLARANATVVVLGNRKCVQPAWVHIFCFWPIHRSIPVSPTTVVSIHSAVLFLHHRCRPIKKLSDHPHWPAVGDSLLSVPLHLPSLQTCLESFSVFIFLSLILFLIFCLTRYPRQFPRPIYHGARPSRDGRRTNGSLRRTSCRGISAPFQLFFSLRGFESGNPSPLSSPTLSKVGTWLN